MTSDDTSESPAPHEVHTGRAIVVVVAFLVIFALCLSTTEQAPSGAPDSSSPTTPPTTSAPTTTTVPHSTIKVQVANGTSTPGAAGGVTTTLQNQGWNVLPPVNTTTAASTSSIYFASGRKWAAEEIAREVGLAKSVIQPLTTAVPVPDAAGDDVVVVIGPGLPTQP